MKPATKLTSPADCDRGSRGKPVLQGIKNLILRALQPLQSIKNLISGGLQALQRTKNLILGGLQPLQRSKNLISGALQPLQSTENVIWRGLQALQRCKNLISGALQHLQRTKNLILTALQRSYVTEKKVFTPKTVFSGSAAAYKYSRCPPPAGFSRRPGDISRFPLGASPGRVDLSETIPSPRRSGMVRVRFLRTEFALCAPELYAPSHPIPPRRDRVRWWQVQGAKVRIHIRRNLSPTLCST